VKKEGRRRLMIPPNRSPRSGLLFGEIKIIGEFGYNDVLFCFYFAALWQNKMRIPPTCIVLFIGLLGAGAVLTTVFGCIIDHEPYPLFITAGCGIALIIVPFLFYSEENSLINDIGWFLTGVVASATLGLIMVLYHAQHISLASTFLSIGSIVLTSAGFGLAYWFLFGQNRHLD
jgi:hypothetical protein